MLINYFDECQNALDAIPDISFDTDNIPNYITSITPKLSADVETTMECEINGDLFNKLCGVDMAIGKNFTLEFDSPSLVQVRKHRKKRINKKWAKRYGYKTVFKHGRITECEVTSNFENDTLTIKGRTLLGF